MDAVAVMVFGSPAEARRGVRRVARVHDRVRGALRDPEVVPAGPYTAHDRRVQVWVLATLVDSTEILFERYVRPFHPGEADRLWSEWRRFGRQFGIPDGLLPRTRADLRSYVARTVEEELLVTPTARALAETILRPRIRLLPARAREPARAYTTSLLPPRLREGYGLPFGSREESLARRFDAVVRAAWRRVPEARRRLPYAYLAGRRLILPRG